MSVGIMILIMFATLLIVIMIGVPIAFALGSLGLFFGLLWVGPSCLPLFINRIYGQMSSGSLPAIPLFIFMGFMLERSGSTKELYRVIYKLLGNIKGGLAITTIVISTLFAACSGVIGASIVTMGLIALPSMIEHKYNKSLACGSVMAGGTLGIIIPPSILLILYGPIAGISVAKLFASSMVPGLLLSFIFIVYIIVITKIKPTYGPSITKEEKEQINKKQLLIDFFYYLLPPLVLILMVLGGIFFGVVATTEAAAVGAFGSLFLTLAYRQFSWKIFKETVIQTLKTSSMVLFVALGASLFTVVFISLGGTSYLTDFAMSLPGGKWVILLFMMLIIFFLGMFIDWIGILYICVPVFTPIAAELGFNPLWFATVVCVNLQTSFLSPPFAYSIFFLKSIAPKGVTLSDIYRGAFSFIILQLIGLIFLIVFPNIALWLPNITF
ncbi:TRAP transporter large permease subunit [Candidatus Bathyarchaeota archaeon]|nr:TRAP transporter large permease subunit [Candidatus Bathyarchaeota archaeon]